MSETPIVTAEAVEVPRPEHWIGVSVSHGTVHLWSNTPRGSSDELMADAKRYGDLPQFLVRIPGSPPPAPKPATPDAEIDIILHRLSAANGFVADAQDRSVSVLIIDAMERLAKIRGGR